MADNTAPNQNQARSIDLTKAPGADLSFDDLFPVEDGNQSQSQAAPEQTPASQAQPVVQTPTEPEFYLKAGSSVYKNREEAEQGLQFKDSVIERLRQFAISQTGFDPLTNKPAGQQQTQSATQQHTSQYLGNGKRYYEDLSKAVAANDPMEYERIQRQYQMELIQQTVGPAAPLLGEVARQKAIRQVSSRNPEFSKFVDSTEYNEILESMPVLKQAIDYAEQDFSMAPRLSELYQLAYLANQGRRRPTQETVTQTPPAPVQSAPAVRPTTTPSTMTPPTPSADTRSWATDPEARSNLIKDMENRGIKDIKW